MVEGMNPEMAEMMLLKKGDIVKGKVTKVEEKQALVDVGYKFDGVLPIGEVSNIHIEKISDVLNVGDEIELKVIKINDEEEKLIFSKKVVDSEKAWDVLKLRFEKGETFEVEIADIVKGGLVANVGVRGFVPASLVEKHFVEDFSDYKGKKLAVKVVELDQEKNKVILSHKAVIDQEEEKSKETILNNLKSGDVIEGTVQRLTDFGAFIDVGGIDGLVHISEMSWNRIEKPSDLLSEGEKVKVKVLRVDPHNHRISLSLKEIQPSPWDKAVETLQIGEIYKGIVKRLTNFGAFVELFPNVEGLVHISHISQQHIAQPSEVLKEGQEVKVKVINVDAEAKRISLSIREAEEKEQLEEAKQNHYEDNQGLNVTLGDVFGEQLKKLK